MAGPEKGNVLAETLEPLGRLAGRRQGKLGPVGIVTIGTAAPEVVFQLEAPVGDARVILSEAGRRKVKQGTQENDGDKAHAHIGFFLRIGKRVKFASLFKSGYALTSIGDAGAV
jgi:hypothetical protein